MGDVSVLVEEHPGLEAVVLRVVGGRLRVGYDPARVDAEQLAEVLRIYG